MPVRQDAPARNLAHDGVDAPVQLANVIGLFAHALCLTNTALWHNAAVNDLVEISRRASTLLARIGRGPASLIKSELEPSREDFAAVFLPSAAQKAYAEYQSLWANPPPSLMRPTDVEIRVVSLFAQHIVDSGEFPGGYRKVAHLLVRDQIWCRFKFLGPGGSDELSYDGLVVCGERWAWFPKPWRVLADDASEGN